MTAGRGRPRAGGARGAALGALLAAAGGATWACDTVGLAPDVPAAIEWAPLPSPAVVLGDTLRTEEGVVARVRAVVRNVAGDTLAASGVRYLYADFNRDSALLVDSTGLVRAVRKPTAEARLAARAGSSLQVLRPLIVTDRPDTAWGNAPTEAVRLVLPDTGRAAASGNTTAGVAVAVRTLAANAPPAGVNGWVVRFELLRPANAANDTAAGAYLVDEGDRPSTVDTTDAGGSASRRVRVRPARFPAAAGTDTVVVRAVVRYRGTMVRGAPLRLAVPVRRP